MRKASLTSGNNLHKILRSTLLGNKKLQYFLEYTNEEISESFLSRVMTKIDVFRKNSKRRFGRKEFCFSLKQPFLDPSKIDRDIHLSNNLV